MGQRWGRTNGVCKDTFAVLEQGKFGRLEIRAGPRRVSKSASSALPASALSVFDCTALGKFKIITFSLATQSNADKADASSADDADFDSGKGWSPYILLIWAAGSSLKSIKGKSLPL